MNDCNGGFVHTQSERFTGKKSCFYHGQRPLSYQSEHKSGFFLLVNLDRKVALVSHFTSPQVVRFFPSKSSNANDFWCALETLTK